MPLTAGIWLGDLWLLPLAFLLAGFPLARLESRLDRVLVGALAVVMIPLELLWLMFLDFDVLRERRADNVLMVADRPVWRTRRHRAADDPDHRAGDAGVRARAPLLRASAPLRRVLAPVLAGAPGWRCSPPTICSTSSTCAGSRVRLALLVLAAVPIIFLVGVLRARLARSAIGDLLVDLREPAEPGALRDALARALRDPTLELAYWVPEYGAYVGPTASPSSCRRRTAAA